MNLKLRILFLSVLVLTLSSSLALAQEPVNSLASLYVAFWPDYDDPSVLVLMTGTLPPDAPLPAQVTVPIPPGAEINAVARVSEQGMADTEFDVQGDTLTLTTPDPRFRVEFYAPYGQDGDSRTFDYTFAADFSVEEFVAEIQQPLNAVSLSSEPPAANTVLSPNDGLTYHALPARSLPAGTPFNLGFRYEMGDPGFTAGAAPPAPPVEESAPSSGTIAPGVGIDWLLVGAAVLILVLAVAVTWLVATRNSGGRSAARSRRPRKPAPRERQAEAIYCHNCGTPANKGDQFCRSCGSRLKNI